MNKYLTIFLKTGVFFGFAMGLFYAFQSSSLSAGVRGGLAAGALFGFAMALLSYAADRQLSRRGINPCNSDVRHYRLLIANGRINELFPLCKKALLSVKRCTLKTEDADSGVLSAKVGFSWKSFGELVRVAIKPDRDGKMLIEISSAPSAPLTMVDYGKNFENIVEIESYLSRELGNDIMLRA
ncbi:MAG: hypothetical protein ACRD2L_24615 [Terriglobia bacterium]